MFTTQAPLYSLASGEYFKNVEQGDPKTPSCLTHPLHRAYLSAQASVKRLSCENVALRVKEEDAATKLRQSEEKWQSRMSQLEEKLKDSERKCSSLQDNFRKEMTTNLGKIQMEAQKEKADMEVKTKKMEEDFQKDKGTMESLSREQLEEISSLKMKLLDARSQSHCLEEKVKEFRTELSEGRRQVERNNTSLRECQCSDREECALRLSAVEDHWREVIRVKETDAATKLRQSEEKWQSRMSQLEEELKEMTTNLRKIHMEAQKEKADMQVKIKKMEEDFQKDKRTIETLEKELGNWKIKLLVTQSNRVRQEAASLSEGQSSQTSEVAGSPVVKDHMKDATTKQSEERLQSRVRQLEKELKEIRSFVSRLIEQLMVAIGDHINTLVQLRKKGFDLCQSKKEYESKCNALEESFKKELTAKEESYRQELAAKEESWRQELTAKEESWRQELAAKEESWRQELAAEETLENEIEQSNTQSQLLVAVFLGGHFLGNYGNGLVWLCLLLGPPLAVTTYFHDHYISCHHHHHPHPQSSSTSDHHLPSRVFPQPH
ncbi:hypothetical protein PAMA_019062 [Pampus argenteus]